MSTRRAGRVGVSEGPSALSAGSRACSPVCPAKEHRGRQGTLMLRLGSSSLRVRFNGLGDKLFHRGLEVRNHARR